MEFDLHIVSNGNRANISLEYDNKENIDKERLKKAINDVVDILLNDTSQSDFKPIDGILPKDDSITNNTQPSYIVTPTPLKRYDGDAINGTLDCSKSENKDDKSSIVVKDSKDYLAHIIISQIHYNLENIM